MSRSQLALKSRAAPHPLAKYMKWTHAPLVNTYHNSVNNPAYPKKRANASGSKVTFTVIGNRVTREFLDCCEWANALHKYRTKHYSPPVIRGLTQLEWLQQWNNLKLKYGGEAFCITKPVAVLINDQFLGDSDDLKALLESRYVYRLPANYHRRGVEEFCKFVKSSERSFAYMHITIDGEIVGTFIFMLYTDLVPLTCENFLRLCRSRRGGYGGTPVHRIVGDGWIQCGGYGLKSVPLACENYVVPHDRRGVLSMANDGRHCDNSTQFIVTLQPAEWMDHKYVAFGQLIDGEEALKRVEAVPTRYEAPQARVIICGAGELVLGQKPKPVPQLSEYLEKHIFNLTDFADELVDEIFETVNLELEYKYIASTGGACEGEEGGINIDAVHAAKRFFKKSDDNETRFSSRKQVPTLSTRSSYAAATKTSEPSRVTLSEPSPRPERREPRKLYLALTDVPYTGECDSDMDINGIRTRCLHPFGNISNRIPPTPTVSQYTVRDTDSGATDVPCVSSHEASVYSVEDNEIQEYLSLNADRMSFAGSVIRNIARNLAQTNLLSNLIRSRDHLPESGGKGQRTVVIATPEDSCEDCDQDTVKFLRRRRPTGFVKSEAPESSSEDDSLADDRDGIMSLADLAKMQRHDQLKKSVRIASSTLAKTSSMVKPVARRTTAFVRNASELMEANRHASSLSRLLGAAGGRADSIGDVGPRLIDYKPLTSMAPKSFFLTATAPNRRSLLSEPQEERLLRDPNIVADAQPDSLDNILTLRHGPRLMRRYSSDYVHSRFMIEKAKQRRFSFRTAEFAKRRPSLSVEQYKQKSTAREAGVPGRHRGK